MSEPSGEAPDTEQSFNQLSDALVEGWIRILADDCFLALSGEQIFQRLSHIAESLLRVLLFGETYPGHAGQLGTGLRELGYLPPRAVACIYGLLHRLLSGSSLVAASPDWAHRVDSVLVEFLAGIVVADRDAVLREQSAIHQALTCAMRRVEQAERESSQRCSELERARHALSGAQDRERQRLARELHDGIVQDLAGVRYRLALTHRDASGEAVMDTVLEAENSIADVIEQLRSVIGELRPPVLDSCGLAEALIHYVRQLPRSDEIPSVSLNLAPDLHDLAPDIALCLYRVSQEAIRNALKHARATKVEVTARRIRRGIFLRVSDNGRGFAVPTDLPSLAEGDHYGLLGIAERVGRLQGRLRIRSSASEGTAVVVWVPIAEDARGNIAYRVG